RVDGRTRIMVLTRRAGDLRGPAGTCARGAARAHTTGLATGCPVGVELTRGRAAVAVDPIPVVTLLVEVDDAVSTRTPAGEGGQDRMAAGTGGERADHPRGPAAAEALAVGGSRPAHHVVAAAREGKRRVHRPEIEAERAAHRVDRTGDRRPAVHRADEIA